MIFNNTKDILSTEQAPCAYESFPPPLPPTEDRASFKIEPQLILKDLELAKITEALDPVEKPIAARLPLFEVILLLQHTNYIYITFVTFSIF